jgi:hypothetical protein
MIHLEYFYFRYYWDWLVIVFVEEQQRLIEIVNSLNFKRLAGVIKLCIVFVFIQKGPSLAFTIELWVTSDFTLEGLKELFAILQIIHIYLHTTHA